MSIVLIPFLRCLWLFGMLCSGLIIELPRFICKIGLKIADIAEKYCLYVFTRVDKLLTKLEVRLENIESNCNSIEKYIEKKYH